MCVPNYIRLRTQLTIFQASAQPCTLQHVHSMAQAFTYVCADVSTWWARRSSPEVRIWGSQREMHRLAAFGEN